MQKYGLIISVVLLSVSCFGGPNYPELWFPVGETLTYKIVWGILPIAEAKLSSRWVEEEDEEGKRILVSLLATIRTYAIFDAVYPMDDRVECLVDPETFTPVRSVVCLSEKQKQLSETTIFDYKHGIAHWRPAKPALPKDLAITPDTRDFLSVIFLLRRQKFEPGQTCHYRIMATHKFYDLEITAEKHEKTGLPRHGQISCMALQAQTAFKGFLIQVDRMQGWISEDKRSLCAKFIARTSAFGRIRITLEKVEGPGDDFWLKR